MNRSKIAWLSRLFALVLAPYLGASEKAPAFSLPVWGGGKEVQLENFAGKIVILDFFAYWCAPCLKLSTALESDVQSYYKFGNPHGFPVQVCSINVEREQPDGTADFIRKTGASFVLDDTARVLERYGGESLPFIVIIDGTDRAKGFKIIHRHNGAEPIAELRSIIDGIGGKAGANQEHFIQSSVALRQLRSAFEGLWSSDIALTDTSIEFAKTGAPTEYSLSLSEATMDVRYRPAPVDIVSEPARLSRNRTSVEGSIHQAVGSRLRFIAQGNWYDGYTDYRSLWLNEYYRQLFGSLEGYREARPEGYGVSAGMRWEYLPASGFVQVEGIYGYDRVSPGYEIAPFEPLRRGEANLHSSGARTVFENVLSRRVRLLNELQAIATTGRAWRFGYQGSVNAALSEHWVLRQVLGGTREAPKLSAAFSETALERDWSERWYGRLFFRYYHDTGQIENPLLISAATPGLDSFQGGAGARYQSERISFQLLIGPYFSRYAPATRGSEPFTSLYRSRDWISFQARFEYRL